MKRRSISDQKQSGSTLAQPESETMMDYLEQLGVDEDQIEHEQILTPQIAA